MKSLWNKVQQLEGLIGTKDIDATTNRFLLDVVTKCKERHGDTRWLTPNQIKWLDGIYDRHFA